MNKPDPFSTLVVKTSLVITTTILTTGIIPLEIKLRNSKFTTNLTAQARCQEVIRNYRAWWGSYTYLNKCAANRLSRDYAHASNLMGWGSLPAATLGPIGVGTATAASSYGNYVSSELAYCAENYEQAYLRRVNGVRTGVHPIQVSCR